MPGKVTVTFEMGNPDRKKHSTKFDFLRLLPESAEPMGKFEPSFYIPAEPFMSAKRIKVTLEVVE